MRMYTRDRPSLDITMYTALPYSIVVIIVILAAPRAWTNLYTTAGSLVKLV